MKYTTKNTSPTVVNFEMTLDTSDLAAIRPATIAKLSKNLKVAGFRPGKVPRQVAEKNLDQSALESQVVEDAINQSVIIAINESGVQALDRPKVECWQIVNETPGSN